MLESLKRAGKIGLAAAIALGASSTASSQPAPETEDAAAHAAPSEDTGEGWNFNYRDRPEAPAQASTAHEVAVKVSYVVNKRGEPKHCQVVESSGHEKLDKKACSLIGRRFRFEPKVENGRTVLSRRTQTVRFRLKNSSGAVGPA